MKTTKIILNNSSVNFIIDGIRFSPKEYIEKLLEINSKDPIVRDFYGKGGVTESLEKKFAEITGKEKAVYLPSGTMANQLAIKLLNGNKTKAIVPENSHIYRDEGDAAQSIHSKRLIPIGKDKSFFDLEDLKKAIEYLNLNEEYDSGLGTVVIENPVRRADGAFVPIEVIKQISEYCGSNGIRLHLDGSRLHIASAFTKVSVKDYSSHFDTVYISLYKYLNASGGAVLCGDAEIIDRVPHQIKILGGSILQNWNNTAVALHYLDGIDERWKKIIKKSKILIKKLNKINGISLTARKNLTNVCDLKLSKSLNASEVAKFLYSEHKILLGRADEKGIIKFVLNESLLMGDIGEIVNAFKEGIKKS